MILADQPDDKPPSPAPTPQEPQDYIERAAADPNSKRRAWARIELTRRMLGRGYSPSQVIGWLEHDTPDKTWKCGRSTARGYVDKALEADTAEVTQPKDRKQARSRAMLTMAFQRAMELALDPAMKHRAAGLLTAAIAATDKIARIDGAYAFDASALVPVGLNPATAEDALRIIQHAHATAMLAQRRGAMLPARPLSPPVIDVTSEDGDDLVVEGDEPEPTGDAN